MNKLNKELLERALVEGVDESYEEARTCVSLAVGACVHTGFHLTGYSGSNKRWQYVCIKEEYLAAKAEKESLITLQECKTNFGTSQSYEEYKKGYKAMRDTKSEYDIGCYYEFSDDKDFSQRKILKLSRIPSKDTSTYQTHFNGTSAIFKYIRPLTVKAGEIRKPKPLSGFINVYNNRCHPSPIHKTKGIADEYCNPEARLACIDLSQFNEGEGL